VNDDEIVDFVEFTRDKPVDVRFIEYMPFDGNKWNVRKMLPYGEMLKMIRDKYPEFTRLGDRPNDTSKAWKVCFCSSLQNFAYSLSICQGFISFSFFFFNLVNGNVFSL
jgi:molybdenum cofactor biosynthesis enzyme MoaA